MSTDRRRVDELTIEELEQVLARRKREARHKRVEKYRKRGRALRGGEAPNDDGKPPEPLNDAPKARSRTGQILNGLLLTVEIGVVFGLLYIAWLGINMVREINAESSAAFAAEGELRPTPQATAVISAVVLPGGHTPPDASGNSEFNVAEIPEHLRPLVQATIAAVEIPEPAPEQASRIVIPKINVDHPVVQGDGFEQLKLGIGQHIGTANPGQPGNMVVSAHNDIFGEIFRYLDQLEPGDTITVYTATSEYTYVVTGRQVVSPTDVHVMQPTIQPTITLISCYPYLVDTERIVVFAELADG